MSQMDPVRQRNRSRFDTVQLGMGVNQGGYHVEKLCLNSGIK
jgi:hypothetical protein